MKKIVLLLGVALSLSSCNKNELEPKIEENETRIVLGEEINDPYRIENMQQAFDNLYGKELKVELSPTHKYIRLLPKNDEEWDLLKEDTAIVLFDYPLNYEVQEGGTSFHDASLPDTAITWQYTVVPIDYKLPNIQQELLYEVYIPEEDSELKSASFSAYDIEEKAYQITGNYETNGTTELKASRWSPSGIITVDDDKKGDVPVWGASVHTRWCTNVRTCLTDAKGIFSEGHKFLYKVNYSIKWERSDFDIRSGDYGQAWYNGPKQKGAWNLRITKGSASWLYAHIHRAAEVYYYHHSDYGIQAPSARLNSEQKLHIGGKTKEGRSKYLDFKKLILASQVAIYQYTGKKDYAGNAVQKPSYEIFATTIHELAHVSHWNMGYSTLQYVIDWTKEPVIAESWAACVEYYITSNIYGGNCATDYQGSEISDMNDGYTSLFIDMIDVYNQRVKGDLFPIDKVSGYTLEQIENALDKTYAELKVTPINPEILQVSFESFGKTILKNKLKKLYENPTEDNLDELFDNFDY